MLRHPARIALTLVLATLVPMAAEATIRSSVRIRWDGPRPEPARPGVEFTGRFRITAGGPGVLEDVRLEGAGWTVLAVSAPGRTALSARASRVVEFRAVPADPAAPLYLRATFEGRPVEQSIRLDAASLAQVGRRRPMAFADGEGPRALGSRKGERMAGGQIIRFHGRFAYVRDGGPTLGADNLAIRIMDDDSPDPFDEEIWAGRTDANGNFDVTINWDDCDISGCDDPDVYLEATCAIGEVSVHMDDAFNTLYGWSTSDQTIDNFTGNEIDFGTMLPDDPAEYAAPHIFTSIVRAHRYSSTRGNMAPGNLVVLWPDNDDATSYDPDDELIHIAPVRTWNEITHSHEFAHHLHNVFGTLPPPNYCNGQCDTDGCGHCRWCQENQSDAWVEGWANYFGALVAESYNESYGVQPWVSIAANNEGRWFDDNLSPCTAGGPLHPATTTEGFIDAFLRDIRDTPNDDHDGDAVADCDVDAMSLGDDEIFVVFKDDDPTDVLQFIQKFRARYPQHDQDLWSTARNVSVGWGFALPAPVVLSQPIDCRIVRAGESLTLSVQGNGSLLRYQWRWNGTPLTDLGGVSGSSTRDLTLNPITANAGGLYDCVVSTCDGTQSVTSSAARVTVDAPPGDRPLVSWGENASGQLGNGTTGYSQGAFPHANLPDVIQADGGRGFTVALHPNGTVYSWGAAGAGELGNGQWYAQQNSPGLISTLADVVQIACGTSFGLALGRDGLVRGWGWNLYGPLGTGDNFDRSVPDTALYPGCVKAIAAGQFHAVALMADGTVWTSGYNGPYGSLGHGSFDGGTPTPVQVIGLTDVVEIAAGGLHTVARKADGTVWAWGDNSFGTLGDGTTNHAHTPRQVIGLTNIRSIGSTVYNGYAIRADGECFGWGWQCSVGDGSCNGLHVTPQPIPALSGLDVRRIDGGGDQWALALLGNGRLKAWGTNTAAGSTYPGVFNTTSPPGNSTVPIDVPHVENVTGFGTGYATVHAFGTVAVADAPIEGGTPAVLALRATPNPARGRAVIAYDLPSPGRVALAVYDVAGRRVRSLVAEERPAGRHAVVWNGSAESGIAAAAGIYFVRLETAGQVLRQPLVRLD